jgi:carboxyl-terminal processing protease
MYRPRFAPPPRAFASLLTRAALAGVIAFVALCAASTAGLPLSSARAPSNVDVELDALHSELSDLHSEYFKPLNTADALNAAWDAAVAYAHTRGGPATPRTVRPPTNGPADAALARFDTAFHALADEETAALSSLSLADQAIFQTKLGQQALAGLAGSAHENHTYYITPEDWSRRYDSGQSYAGVGITVSQVGDGFYVSEVFTGSPADGAGFARGDQFIAVDGQSVPPGTGKGQGLDFLTTHLRGDPDTSVGVTLQRSGVQRNATIRRAHVYVPDFEGKIVNGVGYMRLRGFPPASTTGPDGKTAVQELDDALARFEAAGVTGWVLDLRGDGGGYLDTMNAFASRFLPKDAPLLVSRTNSGDSVSRADGAQKLPARPLTVIVDGSSASASEILASALQDNGRALVVGTKSAGVANAADRDALPDGGGLSVTVVQSLTAVQKRPLDGQGVTPDAPIDASSDDIPLGRDRVLERAESLSLNAAPPAAAVASH